MSNSFVTPWTVAHKAPLSWNSPGKNTGVGCHFLLQGIFLSQGSNPHLLQWQADSLPLSHLGGPKNYIPIKFFFLKNKEIICVPQEKPIVLAFIFKIISLVGFLVGVVSEERDKSRYKQVLYGRSDFLENNNVLKL